MVLHYVWYEGWDIPFLASVLADSLIGHQCLFILYRLDAGPCVTGKSAALHKSFKTEAEAYIWFQMALLNGTVELIN